ncbi:MAG: precorrin-6A reductase [Lachnospiraceae bacterium]|nr:precorrin-6A reductase [Lachnospiraceae bacterium]
MKRLILFGGTTEGYDLSYLLAEEGYDVTVSVATDIGAEQYRDHDAGMPGQRIRTIQGRKNKEELESLLSEYDACIDATHPYAVEITRNLKEICENRGMPCYRYIRSERSDQAVRYEQLLKESERFIQVSSAPEAAEYLKDKQGNILITTGSKEIGCFGGIDKKRLYIRVLPTVESIKACESIDLPHRNIIAMWGPFSSSLNEALITQYDIAYVVTKESGTEGGYDDKLSASYNSGCTAVVIKRPEESGMTFKEIKNDLSDRYGNGKSDGSDCLRP